MPKIDPISRRDSRFAAQLRAFRDAVGPYAAGLGLSAGQVGSQAAAANFFSYVLLQQTSLQNTAQALTTYKDGLRRGPARPEATPLPEPFIPTPVPPVPPGIEARFRALIRQVKASPGYNQAIGRALGIEGAEMTPPDLSAIQPPLEVSISGGSVRVDWTWDGYAAFLDMIELRVDRGDGAGARFLTHDTTPGYIDRTPFPATPTKWIYTAIYWLDDHRVGQWSNAASVIVGA